MLKLHQAIAAVAPIDGIADLGDGQYRIDFTEDATAEQQSAAWALLENFTPSVPPNWEQFRPMLLMNGSFLRIVASTPNGQLFAATIADMLWRAGDDPTLLSAVVNIWAAIVYSGQPTAAEIESINGVIAACSMPFYLDGQGMMQLGAAKSPLN